MTYDPKGTASKRQINQERRNWAYGVLAAVLAVITIVSLWVAGVFSPSAAYVCNVQVTQLGSNLVVSLSGTGITPTDCAQSIKQSNTGNGSSAKQITSIPSTDKLACAGTENGSKGAVLVKVYTDGTPFSEVVGSVYCGQLDKTG